MSGPWLLVRARRLHSRPTRGLAEPRTCSSRHDRSEGQSSGEPGRPWNNSLIDGGKRSASGRAMTPLRPWSARSSPCWSAPVRLRGLLRARRPSRPDAPSQPTVLVGWRASMGPARAAATTASVKLAPAKSGAGAPVGHTTVLAGTRATARRRSPACSTSARDATVMKTAVSACVSRAIAAAVRVRATPTPTARWTKSVTCSAAPSRREGNLRMLSDTVPIRAIVVSSTLGAHCARTPVARVRIS